MFAEIVPVKHGLGADAPPAQDVWDGKTIQVSGLGTSTTDDAIRLFFESNKRSGGDRVEKMQRDKKKMSHMWHLRNLEVSGKCVQMSRYDMKNDYTQARLS